VQLALMCLRQLNSISASAGIPSAVDGAPQNKDHNDSASSESVIVSKHLHLTRRIEMLLQRFKLMI
jgi:hypothetical protein